MIDHQPSPFTVPFNLGYPPCLDKTIYSIGILDTKGHQLRKTQVLRDGAVVVMGHLVTGCGILLEAIFRSMGMNDVVNLMPKMF